MANITHVCLSDMHLGEEDSLLTNLIAGSSTVDPKSPSPVLVQLVECLKLVLKKNDKSTKPTLVLNGDIVELATSTTSEAAMVFQRFIELVMMPENKLFERIIFIPGNHDHHLWETSRETQYVNYIADKKVTDTLNEPWHTTNMFSKTVSSYFLSNLVRRFPSLEDFTIEIAYPNYAVASEDKSRSVVFSHGHYTESIYHFMTTLRMELFAGQNKPTKVWDIEKENFAWIDFVWSVLGRSGAAGGDVEVVYEKMYEKAAFKNFLEDVAKTLAKKHDIPYVPKIPFVMKEDEVEAKVLKWALDKLLGSFVLEKHKTDKAASEELLKGLLAYLDGPLHSQFIDEGHDSATNDVTFIFGHTHKPFAQLFQAKNYNGNVKVINSGGWVVESTTPNTLHGGSIVLVDSNLEAVALRMYNEKNVPEEYTVSLEEAGDGGARPSDFFLEINELLKPNQEPWASFSAAAANAVAVRYKNLKERIY